MQVPVNVLFLQSQTLFGADAAVHAHVMRRLDRGQFVVHAACTPGDGEDVPASLQRIREIPDVRVRLTHFVPSFRNRGVAGLVHGLCDAAAAPLDFLALRRYVLRERIRIIHTTERPRDASYGLALARSTGAKAVVHVHVKWSSEYGAAARYCVRAADAVFAVSKFVADTVVSTGTPSDRVFTLLNCIEPTRFDPELDGAAVRREFSIPSDALLLTSISRLFSWKGQRELLRAFALARAELPNTKLMIVGADEPRIHGGSFTAELTELSRELGVAADVVFTGMRSDVANILAATDLFTMPSFEEPFGLVFLEAMAMRKPVVAVDNGGTPEVVEHGRSGLLSPAWDVPTLASNIVALLKDPARRMAMGSYARSRVLDYFNAERLARETAAAYRDVLAR